MRTSNLERPCVFLKGTREYRLAHIVVVVVIVSVGLLCEGRVLCDAEFGFCLVMIQ